jgi:hypothetical protein
MRKLWPALAGVGVILFGGSARAEEPIAVAVLYAGNHGSDREHDFTNFLKKSFARVGTVDYREFKEGDAKGYDVVILDWTSIYRRDDQGKIKPVSSGIDMPKAPALPDTFNRPTILIGAAGGTATMRSRLKIDWL